MQDQLKLERADPDKMIHHIKDLAKQLHTNVRDLTLTTVFTTECFVLTGVCLHAGPAEVGEGRSR